MTFKIIVRKVSSLLKKSLVLVNSSFLKLWFTIGNDKVAIGKDMLALGILKIACTDGGAVEIGDNFVASSDCTLICKGGVLVIGDNVFLGQGVIIVCANSINIGSDSLLAEYVVVRDQDHLYGARPIRSAGFSSSPVEIGDDVWIGAKASVLRGASIGSGSIIGAHSLVKTAIPSSVLAAGAPAKVLKVLIADG